VPANNVQFLKSIVSLSQRPLPQLNEIAITGRSNVGKSSLINTLFNRKKLAKVSSTPGKTRLINYYCINNDYYLVDLPGYGYAKRAKKERQEWKKMLEAYFSKNLNISIVLVLVDARLGLLDLDRVLIDWLRHYHLIFAIVLTKIDKISRNELHKTKSKLLEDLPGIRLIPFSAKTKSGQKELSELLTTIERN
jgi:GTP-binding protein